jgi:hypothetical protein
MGVVFTMVDAQIALLPSLRASLHSQQLVLKLAAAFPDLLGKVLKLLLRPCMRPSNIHLQDTSNTPPTRNHPATMRRVLRGAHFAIAELLVKALQLAWAAHTEREREYIGYIREDIYVYPLFMYFNMDNIFAYSMQHI